MPPLARTALIRSRCHVMIIEGINNWPGHVRFFIFFTVCDVTSNYHFSHLSHRKEFAFRLLFLAIFSLSTLRMKNSPSALSWVYRYWYPIDRRVKHRFIGERSSRGLLQVYCKHDMAVSISKTPGANSRWFHLYSYPNHPYTSAGMTRSILLFVFNRRQPLIAIITQLIQAGCNLTTDTTWCCHNPA